MAEERIFPIGGDNGPETIEGSPESNRFANYMCHMELRAIGWSDEKIADYLELTMETLRSTFAEFEEAEEDEE